MCGEWEDLCNIDWIPWQARIVYNCSRYKYLIAPEFKVAEKIIDGRMAGLGHVCARMCLKGAGFFFMRG